MLIVRGRRNVRRVLFSCCVDYVAAKHVDADGIVHFGPACFSQPSGTIPCLYIYEKECMDCLDLKRQISEKFTGSVVVCLDTPYAHLFGKFIMQI